MISGIVRYTKLAVCRIICNHTMPRTDLAVIQVNVTRNTAVFSSYRQLRPGKRPFSYDSILLVLQTQKRLSILRNGFCIGIIDPCFFQKPAYCLLAFSVVFTHATFHCTTKRRGYIAVFVCQRSKPDSVLPIRRRRWFLPRHHVIIRSAQGVNIGPWSLMAGSRILLNRRESRFDKY